MLSPLWDSVAFWRWSGLVGWGLLVLGVTFGRKLAEFALGLSGREHDVAVFGRADEIADESFLDNLLNGSLYNRGCRLSEIQRTTRLAEHLLRIENQYLDRRLRRVAGDLAGKLSRLSGFVARHFFDTGRDEEDTRLKLYPDPIPKNAYDRAAEELNRLTEEAWEAFKRYRAEVKRRLKT